LRSFRRTSRRNSRNRIFRSRWPLWKSCWSRTKAETDSSSATRYLNQLLPNFLLRLCQKSSTF